MTHRGQVSGNIEARKDAPVSWLEHETHEDFRRARRQEMLARIAAILSRTTNDLLPLDEVRRRLSVRAQHYRGYQTVPLDQIIGSEGRYADFDRQFLPRFATLRDRWISIDRAHYQDTMLPPVELYKMGDVYFVKDGNHRISVARQRGQRDIDAFVTELEINVPLSTTMSVRDLLLKEEYSDFLEWTALDRLRPAQRIEFTELGGYLVLVGHINTHRYYLGLEQGREIDRDEAVCHWYDCVYLPVVETIREQGVLRAFPGRTEADLYRWIMDHRWYLREHGGDDPGPQRAAADYAARFGQSGSMPERLIRNALAAVRRRLNSRQHHGEGRAA
jgi:hypothetical protein